jgi:uncharacterized protein (TIGR02285 family)
MKWLIGKTRCPTLTRQGRPPVFGRLALFLLAFQPVAAEAKDRVDWIVASAFPPAHIASGPYAQQGVIDVQLKWLLQRLDMFDNAIVEATNARLIHEIAARDGQCTLDVFSTPDRQKIALFSRSVAYAQTPPGLLVRAGSVAKLAPARDKSGAVDLEALAGLDGLIGILAKSRGFGPTVSNFTEKHQDHLTLVQDVMQALKLLDNGRGDYTFGYWLEAQYYYLTLDRQSSFVFVPIAGDGKAMRSYVACSKGPIGERVIQEVDRVLTLAGRPPPYIQDARRWFDPQEFAVVSDPSNWVPDPKIP